MTSHPYFSLGGGHLCLSLMRQSLEVMDMLASVKSMEITDAQHRSGLDSH